MGKRLGLEVFWCEAWGCWLSRANCGQRYEEAEHAYGPRGTEKERERLSLCHRCVIGRKHASGINAYKLRLKVLAPHAITVGGI
jgi:hypothetical protein